MLRCAIQGLRPDCCKGPSNPRALRMRTESCWKPAPRTALPLLYMRNLTLSAMPSARPTTPTPQKTHSCSLFPSKIQAKSLPKYGCKQNFFMGFLKTFRRFVSVSPREQEDCMEAPHTDHLLASDEEIRKLA